MKTALKLTKKQEELLYLLRLDGLRREIELEEAKAAYAKADEIEKAVKQYVIDHNEYYADLRDGDSMNGERITDQRDDFMMNESVFGNDYMPKVQAAFKELYGIDNPLNFVYSEPFRAARWAAEREYMMIAVDFLKISGRQEEAAQLEKAVKGYLNPKLEAQLLNIIRNFINGK